MKNPVSTISETQMHKSKRKYDNTHLYIIHISCVILLSVHLCRLSFITCVIFGILSSNLMRDMLFSIVDGKFYQLSVAALDVTKMWLV